MVFVKRKKEKILHIYNRMTILAGKPNKIKSNKYMDSI